MLFLFKLSSILIGLTVGCYVIISTYEFKNISFERVDRVASVCVNFHCHKKTKNVRNFLDLSVRIFSIKTSRITG